MNVPIRSRERTYKLIVLILCLLKNDGFLFSDDQRSAENTFDNHIEKLLKQKPYLKIYINKHLDGRSKRKRGYSKYVAYLLLAVFTAYKCTDYYRCFYTNKINRSRFFPRKLINFSRGIHLVFLFMQIAIIKKLLSFAAELFEDNIKK